MSQILKLRKKDQFTDRTYNGDFGLLPLELWDIIYIIKRAMEKAEQKDCEKKMDVNIKAQKMTHFYQAQQSLTWLHSKHFDFSWVKERFMREEQNIGSDPFNWFADNFYPSDTTNFFTWCAEQKRPRIKNKKEMVDKVRERLQGIKEMMVEKYMAGSVTIEELGSMNYYTSDYHFTEMKVWAKEINNFFKTQYYSDDDNNFLTPENRKMNERLQLELETTEKRYLHLQKCLKSC